MKKQIVIIILIVLAVLILNACSTSTGNDTTVSSQQEGAGQKIFQANCSACHLTEGRQVLVGPSMDGLTARAGNTVDGMDAEAYIRQSILDPAAHVGDGFTNLMPNIYGTTLSEQELEAVVAYLLTFK